MNDPYCTMPYKIITLKQKQAFVVLLKEKAPAGLNLFSQATWFLDNEKPSFAAPNGKGDFVIYDICRRRENLWITSTMASCCKKGGTRARVTLAASL